MKINMDKTFCVSSKCPKMNQCERNYLNLIGLGVVFDKQIAMYDFYVPSLECDKFIDIEENVDE